MKVDLDKCKGCGICVEVCPLAVMSVESKKIRIGEGCVECRTCLKVCPHEVFTAEGPDGRPACTACPIACRIPEGGYGACMRYYNEKGTILRKGRVHTYDEVQQLVEGVDDSLLRRPLLTGIGTGTTYPDFRPSPFIVSGVRDGIEIVTVVTEAPLSYSGVKIKVDTDVFVGEESKRIYTRKKGSAFGQLLVLSLYQQFKQEGEAFKPRYLEILSAGGSESPERILAAAGIDIYDSNFWQGGFDVISHLVAELEALPVV